MSEEIKFNPNRKQRNLMASKKYNRKNRSIFTKKITAGRIIEYVKFYYNIDCKTSLEAFLVFNNRRKKNG